MEPHNESGSGSELPLAPADAQRRRHADNRDILRALVKDARNVAERSLVLQDQAGHAVSTARALRTLSGSSRSLEETCLTVPEACSIVGICERTLRVALREPVLADRLVVGSRKVGTFYKTIKLLPPDLVADLQSRFAAKKKSVGGPK